MYDEPEVMKELHALREKLAEEQKDLTPEDLCARLNELGRRYADELGLRIHKSAEQTKK